MGKLYHRARRNAASAIDPRAGFGPASTWAFRGWRTQNLSAWAPFPQGRQGRIYIKSCGTADNRTARASRGVTRPRAPQQAQNHVVRSADPDVGSRGAVEGVDAVLCLTSAVKTALEQSFRVPCPTLVLPSGAALPAVPSSAGGDATCRDIDVIYAGKLEGRKGLPILLAAMRHLPGRRLWVLAYFRNLHLIGERGPCRRRARGECDRDRAERRPRTCNSHRFSVA